MKEIVDKMDRLRTVGNISIVNILIGAITVLMGWRNVGVVEEMGFAVDLLYLQVSSASIFEGKRFEIEHCRFMGKFRGKGTTWIALVTTCFLMRSLKNMLLDALTKDEKVDEAYEEFEDMKKKHCNPDEYTYTILI